MEGAHTRLIVIDGTNIFWRSYHGLIHQHLEYGGQPTWAIFGTINAIANFIKQHRPTHVVVAFDLGKSAYRRELYPEYKAGRHESSTVVDFDDANNQMAQAQKLLADLGVPIWREKGVEADDIMGTIVDRFHDQVGEIILFTGDKDMRQLIRSNVVVIHPSLGKRPEERWDVDRVLEHYEVSPDRLPEVWALSGDKVDNIPGVPGVGEKTAIKLITKYGSISGVLMSDEKKIVGHEDSAHLSYKLVQIRPDLSGINWTLKEMEFIPTPANDEAKELKLALDELGFDVILSRWKSGTLWSERGIRLKDLKNSG